MTRGQALRSRLRWPAAALGLIAAAAYVPVIPQQWAQAAYLGLLSALAVAGCLVLSALLLRRDTPTVYGAASLFGRIAVLGLVFMRLVWPARPSDQLEGWLDLLGIVSLVAATAMAISCSFAIARRRRDARTRAEQARSA